MPKNSLRFCMPSCHPLRSLDVSLGFCESHTRVSACLRQLAVMYRENRKMKDPPGPLSDGNTHVMDPLRRARVSSTWPPNGSVLVGLGGSFSFHRVYTLFEGPAPLHWRSPLWAQDMLEAKDEKIKRLLDDFAPSSMAANR